jgi:hypothetical protein
MTFPARYLNLFQGFSMAMLNNQRVSTTYFKASKNNNNHGSRRTYTAQTAGKVIGQNPTVYHEFPILHFFAGWWFRPL